MISEGSGDDRADTSHSSRPNQLQKKRATTVEGGSFQNQTQLNTGKKDESFFITKDEFLNI